MVGTPSGFTCFHPVGDAMGAALNNKDSLVTLSTCVRGKKQIHFPQ